jgi:hypothetical protein
MKRLAAFVILTFIASVSSAAGFDDRYTARVGDLGSDADLDVYLRHNPQIVFVSVGGVRDSRVGRTGFSASSQDVR